MAEQTTTTEFNFTRPDGSMGGAWSAEQSRVETEAQKCIDSLKALGANGQVVEIVTRTKVVDYSDTSHFKSLSTDG